MCHLQWIFKLSFSSIRSGIHRILWNIFRFGAHFNSFSGKVQAYPVKCEIPVRVQKRYFKIAEWCCRTFLIVDLSFTHPQMCVGACLPFNEPFIKTWWHARYMHVVYVAHVATQAMRCSFWQHLRILPYLFNHHHFATAYIFTWRYTW